MLVTNGVTRVVKDQLIGRLGFDSPSADAAATNIVNAALALKTTDDATCLAVSFSPADAD